MKEFWNKYKHDIAVVCAIISASAGVTMAGFTIWKHTTNDSLVPPSIEKKLDSAEKLSQNGRSN